MKPGIALMPFASMTFSPCAGAAPAVTETILPPRTTIVPESITWPLPTMMRAFVMATSCAAATIGASDTATTRLARTSILFIESSLVQSSSRSRRARGYYHAALAGTRTRPVSACDAALCAAELLSRGILASSALTRKG